MIDRGNDIFGINGSGYYAGDDGGFFSACGDGSGELNGSGLGQGFSNGYGDFLAEQLQYTFGHGLGDQGFGRGDGYGKGRGGGAGIGRGSGEGYDEGLGFPY